MHPPPHPHHPAGGHGHAPSPAAAPGLSVADPGLRFLARLVDVVLALFCTFVVGIGAVLVSVVVAGGGEPDEAGPVFPILLVGGLVLVAFLYEWLQVAKWGRTIGKRVVGLRIVRADDGRPVSAGRAAVRAFCYSPGLYHVTNWLPVVQQLNLLWLLWDRPLRQCLHDKLARTVVVEDRRTAPGPSVPEGWRG
ncbi:RDD family protein [Marinactinospora rubrisoli]|uniref:RDD family protein n=1 Tax=Marinactinospora rubrisoli TaxID=2715399 RepID=A0ABW2KIQ3_9ACTN